MKFELDEYYFNRAGDKVKYVGWPVNDDLFHFRREEGFLYSVNYHGFANPGFEESKDILGKWEINDDPDRVYILDTGLELRDLRTHRIPDNVAKILIKPKPDVSIIKEAFKILGEKLKAEERTKKIELLSTPSDKVLADNWDNAPKVGSFHILVLKINELINAFNERLG